MVTFSEVRNELSLLISPISTELNGGGVAGDITVTEPVAPRDELYFVRLVAWSYVVLFELFPVPLKRLVTLLRASDNAAYKRFCATRDAVHAIRTVQSHNLGEPSKHNERLKNLASAWMTQYGGSPSSWDICCSHLCDHMYDAFKTLRSIWLSSVSTAEDKEAFIDDLKSALLKDWPAYSFDSAVIEAADTIGLNAFDVVAYRDIHIESWRRLANFFQDRDEAHKAVKRAIFVQMKGQFGDLASTP